MKRLATKAMLTPRKLTAAERSIIYRTTKVHRELRFLNFVLDGHFLQGPLSGIEDGWRQVFRRIYSKYRARIRFEDSFSLCYEALRQCVLRNKHRKLGYVYRSCENAHNDQIKRIKKEHKSFHQLPDEHNPMEEPDMASVDFALDVEAAIEASRLGEVEADICRKRLIEQRTYEEIGQSLGGLHRVQVRRKFLRAVRSLGSLLADYGIEQPEATTSPQMRPKALPLSYSNRGARALQKAV
jgi:DNA-directed RNA polymerase specialized sigma24 family protein